MSVATCSTAKRTLHFVPLRSHFLPVLSTKLRKVCQQKSLCVVQAKILKCRQKHRSPNSDRGLLDEERQNQAGRAVIRAAPGPERFPDGSITGP